MKILVLIPARGGSKRLPGKNIRLLGDRPLIVWTIDLAKNIPKICDILVSTDDIAIAEVASKAGALVPWLRPAELATDTATSVDVCLHALDWYEKENGKVDGILLLQPTSPFRNLKTLIQGLALFKQNDRPVVGVSLAESHPLWCFKVEGESMAPFVDGGGLKLRSQDLPPAFKVNGSFYLISPDSLRKLKTFFSEDMIPLIFDKPEESIDIDTELDWKMAEFFLQLNE
jgi:CMP-N,N'-diacetyllegionaminic acid synthase